MPEASWLPALVDAFKIGGSVGGGAFLFALADRIWGRRDKAMDRRTEEQKALQAEEDRRRKNLYDDLEHARQELARTRVDLKEATDACDKAYDLVTRWRRCARRLDDWAHDTLGDARNEIQRLASMLRIHAPDVAVVPMQVPQVPILETLMVPDPPTAQPPA